MSKTILKLLTIWSLLLISTQLAAYVVFTTTPANSSPASTPLTFSWVGDCTVVTIVYGDGFTDTNPTTPVNTITSFTHIYELAGTYPVMISGTNCTTIPGSQDSATVVIGNGVSGTGSPTPTQVNIERLQLYFDNNLPKVTVPRNKTNLQAHASIRYSGSGLFQAFWEVDGRVIERIDRHLLDGDTLELSTPDYFSLPTFISGPHKVRLVITTPGISPGTLPEAVYFVSQMDEASLKLDLLTPINNSTTPISKPMDFRWFGIEKSQRYLLEIFESGSDQTTFSAYSNQQQYLLKPQIMENLLQQGTRYDWQVSVIDKRGEKVSVTDRNRFSVSKTDSVIDHQFLLIVDDSLLGNSLKQSIIEQYQLDVIEEFPLTSLTQSVTVFQTQIESSQLLNELKQLKGVIGAQPDYIYRTTATAQSTFSDLEPLQDLQILSGLIDFKRLHQQMTGKDSRLAIIDSGVDTSHPDLFDAKITTENMILNENYQPEIHGTAITGIIAAQQNSVGIIGLAPQTNILALRACRQLQSGSSDSECFSSSFAKALDRANDQQVQITNFSFGTPATDPVISHLLNQSHDQGMLLLASAGNDQRQQALSFPSSHPHVLSVAGIDGDQFFPSEQLAQQANILAPSEQIFSTFPGGKHNFLNGTSMSSAIVAGIMSLAIQNRTPAEINPKFNGKDFCKWVNDILKIMVCHKAF